MTYAPHVLVRAYCHINPETGAAVRLEFKVDGETILSVAPGDCKFMGLQALDRRLRDQMHPDVDQDRATESGVERSAREMDQHEADKRAGGPGVSREERL